VTDAALGDMVDGKSDVHVVNRGRDTKRGRFLAGNNGGGRKVGSRVRIAERCLADLAEVWEIEGRGS